MSAAERVRAERAAQGLPTPAAPIGDDVVDVRVAAAYRATATLLASAKASPDRVDPSDSTGGALGAAVVGRGSAAASRSNKKEATARTVASQTAAGG